ncbi:MBL fold metallo-hydrolase [Arthrobacter burdickii]|uniref:MBL fold metallo-hydrolase n=1 Tax=Arthrobacter burdickii TaxID=3035920 RepID=A0ABT8K1F0_9MICC|nr:MBL fold metallo-hydrolase [Arthrobacter burdickii]MDN4611255.1 MBL fold metallo-hydrolase [Arthrobacter burdickii]
MRLIADDCYELEQQKGSHGFVVSGAGRTAVIDPGMSSGFDGVIAELRANEATTGPVTDIVLTHYDADHAQAARRLQEVLGATVWIGGEDADVLRGRTKPKTLFRKVLQRVARVPFPDGARELSGSGEIFPGLEYLPTPGHTPGHYAYQWRSVLFSGDAARVSKDGRVRTFYAVLNNDTQVASRSVGVLAERIGSGTVDWICSGHNAIARAAVRDS